MQLHVVAGRGTATTATPHYATLPPKFRRGLPDGAAAQQQTDCNSVVPQETSQDPSQNANQPGTVYYAMNV